MNIDGRYKKWYAEDIPCVYCYEAINKHHPEIDICPNTGDGETSYWPMDGLQYCIWLENQKKKV